MTCSSNHRQSTGRSIQTQSKLQWVTRRLRDEMHKAVLLLTDDAELSARDAQEKALIAKVWSLRELCEFVGIPIQRVIGA